MAQPVAQRYVGDERQALRGPAHPHRPRPLRRRRRSCPGMLHAAFVRSPFAHARITGIDVGDGARAARRRRRVHRRRHRRRCSTRTRRPLGDVRSGAGSQFTLLATDKVRLVGDPVALVVAESRYVAEDALELIEVDYDELSIRSRRRRTRSTVEPTGALRRPRVATSLLRADDATPTATSTRAFARRRPRRRASPSPAPPPERADGVPRHRRRLRRRRPGSSPSTARTRASRMAR